MRNALIVDDEPYLLEMYREILDSLGVEVAGSAGNGRVAVEQYAKMEPRPSFIMMGYRMPVMNGIEATRRILYAYPGARILFVSADSQVIDEALSAGASGFLIKPFTIGALQKAISDLLD